MLGRANLGPHDRERQTSLAAETSVAAETNSVAGLESHHLDEVNGALEERPLVVHSHQFLLVTLLAEQLNV